MITEYFIDAEKITFEDKNYEPNEFPNTWFIENPIDAEHKQYKLLAYLQRIDNNVNKGFLFPEFYTLEKRFKDLESFIKTYDIVNKDKESVKLFNYIYGLPSASIQIQEVDEIVDRSVQHLKRKYLELTMAISFIKEHIIVHRKEIRDGRKKMHIYIEMCNCNIIEHYTINKKGIVEYIGSFHSEGMYVDDEENNVLEIKTTISLHSKGTILPYILKFILSRT